MKSPFVWQGNNARLLPTGNVLLADGTVLGSGGNSFGTIQADSGTAAVADQSNDTFTVTSSDSSISNTTSAAGDSLDLKLPTTVVRPVNGIVYKAAQTISSTAIDWSLSGVFTKTISTNTTFTFSNTQDGQTIVVVITAGSGNLVTWPTAKWPSGAIPVQTSSGVDVYTFIKVGSTFYGSVVQALA